MDSLLSGALFRGLLARLHERRNPGHRVWYEDMIWPGSPPKPYCRAWFCTCRKAWWPPGAFGPGEKDTVDREPPWERPPQHRPERWR